MNRVIGAALCFLLLAGLVTATVVIPAIIWHSYTSHYPVEYTCDVLSFEQCFIYTVQCFNNESNRVNITQIPSRCLVTNVAHQQGEEIAEETIEGCVSVKGDQTGPTTVTVSMAGLENSTWSYNTYGSWNLLTFSLPCWISYDDSRTTNFSQTTCIATSAFGYTDNACSTEDGSKYLSLLQCLTIIGSIFICAFSVFFSVFYCADAGTFGPPTVVTRPVNLPADPPPYRPPTSSVPAKTV